MSKLKNKELMGDKSPLRRRSTAKSDPAPHRMRSM